MKNFKKRGQSEVISTVLMILIAIAAVTVIAGFVINFVQNQIEKSKCVEVINPPAIEIKNNPLYTCYEKSPSNTLRVQIHSSTSKEILEGFSLEVGGADTITFKIKNNTEVDNVKMNTGETKINLPSENSERTYKFSGIPIKPDTIRLYPIIKEDRICEAISIVNTIEECK